MKQFFFLFLFISTSCHASLTPEQLQQANSALNTVFRAYARAVQFLPDPPSSAIQKLLGVYVWDSSARAVWVQSSGTISGWSFPCIDFKSLPYELAPMENVNCNQSGVCQAIPYSRGYWFGKTPYPTGNYPDAGGCRELYYDSVVPGGVGFSDICGEYGSYGVGAYAGACGQYTSTVPYRSSVFYVELSSVPNATFSEFRPVFQLSAQAINDTLGVRVALGQAFANQGDTFGLDGSPAFSVPVPPYTTPPQGFPAPYNADAYEYMNAMDILDNGIYTSTPLADGAYPPAPSNYWTTGYGGGSSVTVNVDMSGVISAVQDIGTLLSSGPSVSSSTIFVEYDNFRSSITSQWITPISNKLIPSTVPVWTPCFVLDFSSTTWKAPATEYCLTDFTGWDTLLQIIRFSLLLSVFIWGVYFIWEG